VIESDGGGGRI